MPEIIFKDLVKQYGYVTVLEDLDLKVSDGEFLVLLGPSGCGKTTLLNMLAGLVEVTAGEITIGGKDVTDLDPKDRGLAMVFQSYALYPTKTVEGNLKFGLAAQKLPKDEVTKRVNWAADLLQIQPLMKRKPAELSGGQRQRVAIGRALVKNVEVFLFDEPLSNLDAKLRTEMRLEIKKLHNELKKTIVYVTHDQVEAMTMATSIAIMDQGVIQQFGSPDDVYDNPENLFVAKFIGAPPMNIIAATIAKTGDKIFAAHAASGVSMDLSAYEFTSEPADGDKVYVGMRPEHFVIGDDISGKEAAQFELPVLYAEKPGSDGSAYLDSGDEQIAVRVETAMVKVLQQPDARLKIAFPDDRFSVFDASTERRI
ncbi:MAG: ABC transporter ATP-binding protein [OCS116 cluster bacterium]|uniref:ABC transporter ATP-binding protein n=1 Tax=OCS116 cluster bacterium TaxID=2030921 RepID=A0A2A4Z890_9PROT|nr:ABC transporter ATP-binding protein [OCS116 cluster bacterium]